MASARCCRCLSTSSASIHPVPMPSNLQLGLASHPCRRLLLEVVRQAGEETRADLVMLSVTFQVLKWCTVIPKHSSMHWRFWHPRLKSSKINSTISYLSRKGFDNRIHVGRPGESPKRTHKDAKGAALRYPPQRSLSQAATTF